MAALAEAARTTRTGWRTRSPALPSRPCCSIHSAAKRAVSRRRRYVLVARQIRRAGRQGTRQKGTTTRSACDTGVRGPTDRRGARAALARHRPRTRHDQGSGSQDRRRRADRQHRAGTPRRTPGLPLTNSGCSDRARIRLEQGQPAIAEHIRRRLLAKAIEQANVKLKKAGSESIPSLTPHGLRRTFASLLFAIGEPAPYVMAMLGHTTANLTLAVYARQMNRRDGEPERLKALVEGAVWAEEKAETQEATEDKEKQSSNA